MSRTLELAVGAVLAWCAWNGAAELFIGWYSGAEPELRPEQWWELALRSAACAVGALLLWLRP